MDWKWMRTKGFKKARNAMKQWIIGLALILACSGCQSSQKVMKIAATAVPHADLLEVVKEDLKQEGIELRIIEIDDYNLPNRMLAEKQVDANFFQHKPFLDEQVRLYGYDLVPLTAVHIEPLGIYSSTYTELDQLKEGSLVAIPQDPTNESRALLLLEEVGLITLKDVHNPFLMTPLDIVKNPKNLRFEELDAPYLARALEDVDLAVIPSNFALQAHLSPSKDALALESSDSLYANIVVVRADDAEKDEFKKLKSALQSAKLRVYIKEAYKGVILPVSETRATKS